MKFTNFDIDNHDLHKVADLIFETEPDVFSLLFGQKKEKALKRIKNIVKIGDNSFGYNNIYVAIDKDQIHGLTIIYKGGDIDRKLESERISDALDFLGVIRLTFFDKILLNRLLTSKISVNDLYVSNVCVDKESRGKGIGKFLLKNILDYAKREKCNRIIIDVSIDNIVAVGLYKKFGFKLNYKKKSFFWRITILNMIKEL
jgi:ribosomal protein S18 acetylase RimI-like enzyme